MPQCSKQAVARRRAARGALLERELDRMVTLLKQYPGVLRVVLFGSVARGETRAHSDLDLIIVQQTSRRFMDRLDEFYRLLDPRVATDILVYTPAEWETLLAERPFIRQAVREGKVLYAT